MRGREREEFLIAAMQAGLPVHVARKVRSAAATHERLSTAACNGDWPCDNGKRKVVFCTVCGGGMVPSKVKGGVCQCCRVEHHITKLCEPFKVPVTFQGDPRGWTVKFGD